MKRESPLEPQLKPRKRGKRPLITAILGTGLEVNLYDGNQQNNADDTQLGGLKR